jgi:hypothetical protein
VSEWPQERAQAALQLLSIKRLALADVLRYLRHARVYGQPEPPQNLTVTNNTLIVPIEQLTDEELDFYEALVAKGRAIPIETRSSAPADAERK